MRDLNKGTFTGNLGNNPNVQVLDGNVPAANFSRATEEVRARLAGTDIESKRMARYVRGGTGEKNRGLSLPGSLLALLREQFRQFRPVTFLFGGAQPGEPYTLQCPQAPATGRYRYL